MPLRVGRPRLQYLPPRGLAEDLRIQWVRALIVQDDESGPTSVVETIVLNFVRAELAASPVPVDFNPWRFTDESAMLAGFFPSRSRTRGTRQRVREIRRRNQKRPHPRRERQARTRAASCGIEKGLVR
jgi:hypothetical protein